MSTPSEILALNTRCWPSPVPLQTQTLVESQRDLKDGSHVEVSINYSGRGERRSRRKERRDERNLSDTHSSLNRTPSAE